MNFKDLENVESGTIVIGSAGTEREFIGFTSKGRLIAYHNGLGVCAMWNEGEIKNWTFKPEEREIIELLEMINKYGQVKYLDSKNVSPSGAEFNGYTTTPNGRTIKIYADTFEMVQYE